MSEEDIDFLFDDDIDDEDGDSAKPIAVNEKRRRNVLVAAVSVLALTVSAGAFVIYDNLTKGPPPPPPPREITMQLVNNEQLWWADSMCSVMSTWPSRMQDLPDKYSSGSPMKVRKGMIETLEKNAGVLKNVAEDISAIPEKSHKMALAKQDKVTIVENIKKTGNTPSESTSSVSNRVAAAINGYSASLRDMAKDLDSVADYDANGVRTTISRVAASFDEMNDQYAKEISSAFSGDIFDNVVTMDAVSKLETCNGSLINPDELEKEHGTEIEEQSKIREYASLQRCNEFKQNVGTVANKSEEVIKKEKICDDFLSSTDINSSDPLFDSKIDFSEEDAVKVKM